MKKHDPENHATRVYNVSRESVIVSMEKYFVYDFRG